MIFSNNTRFRIQQAVYPLSFVATLKNGTVLGGSVGPNVGGELQGLRGLDETWRLRPGLLWSFTVARRFFGTEPQIPYLLVVGTFGGSHTSTEQLLADGSEGERAGFHALDGRADLSMGWTLGEAWSPYLSVRAFGGPVFWQREDAPVTGTDLYHVSVAAGFNLTIKNRVSVFFDGAFLGLRGLSGGFSVRF